MDRMGSDVKVAFWAIAQLAGRGRVDGGGEVVRHDLFSALLSIFYTLERPTCEPPFPPKTI